MAAVRRRYRSHGAARRRDARSSALHQSLGHSGIARRSAQRWRVVDWSPDDIYRSSRGPADTPPALLVYDAELELLSVRGARRVPYHRFHTGYKTADLAPDELIARIHVPGPRRGWIDTFRKVGTRRAQAIAKVCFAASARIAASHELEDIRIAFGSVGPTVVRAMGTEQTIRGRRLDDNTIGLALATLGTEIKPIDDIRSTARYRMFVARQLLLAFLQSLRGGEGRAS
jgi:xanthine dehydrogenase iron-sulfur cluster and FAD-binding subunit A